jgi:UDP-GlcNAc:undecaprenyl-phosphate/decaprenyl-phosphate GlcNAc-1-phosphate transferase
MFLSLIANDSVKLAFVAALVTSLVLAPLARALARALHVLDKPDGGRKCHGRPIPLWGGVAVYLALVVGLLVVRCGSAGTVAFDQFSTTVILACGLVCLVGCIDDSHDLHARFKLLLQIVAVMPVVLAGYAFDRVVAFGYPIDLGWIGIPLTILWLVGCINAINLLDGLDGLASVVGISTALMMAIIAAITGHPHVGIVALVLAGSLAGFLVYNLPPASIFLGDSGSMVIGLVMGMISIQGALKTSATLSIAVPAVVMSVPMLDTVLAIARRKLSGQSFDTADRGHIHHRLLERGLTNWQALCIIGALCLTTGAAATAATLLHVEWVGWLTAVTLVVLLVRTRAFGHHEVTLAKGRAKAVFGYCLAIATRHFRRIVHGRRATTWQETWTELLTEAAAVEAGGFELLLADQAVQHRYSWRAPHVEAARFAARPLVVALTRPDGMFCQIQMLGLPTGRVERDMPAKLTVRLDALARGWRSDDETMPPAGCGIEVHRVSAGFRRAA